ncbi:MAG: CNNM domain-containing protein [Planctomycetota bacterium]
MILPAIALLLLGIFLSAFFSGSETGFYRASRVRIVLDALDGESYSKQLSKWLLRLINNPTLFVATTLIGNNVANYVTSLAIVLLTRSTTTSSIAELIAPILMAPLLFVYGELMPKNLFFQAPNRLLQLAAPLFLFFTCLFSPIAAVLWGLGRLLETLLGQSPETVRLEIARKEVQEVIEEGLHAGILHRTQRLLSQNFFQVVSRPIHEVATPLSRISSISSSSTIAEARRLAERRKMPDIPVWSERRNNIVGYIRTIDLLMAEDPESSLPEPAQLMKISRTEMFGEVLMKMQALRETLALVVGNEGQTLGILTIDQLTNPLLDGPLDALRR